MTDGRTDGQTNESDFIGRCSTNVESPKLKNNKIYAKQINIYTISKKYINNIYLTSSEENLKVTQKQF